MQHLTINDWEEHQTYRKDRQPPPWIKVHRRLFMSRKWAMLTDAEKGQLVSIWIVAADRQGQVPGDPAILRKLAMLDDEPNVQKFIDLGLLASSGRQSDVKATSVGCQSDAPEAEAEAEAKAEDEIKSFGGDQYDQALLKLVDLGATDEQLTAVRHLIDELRTLEADEETRKASAERERARKPQKKRGQRLATDWKPGKDLITWASKERPDLDLPLTIATFRDYWTAKTGASATKLDWDATFRNWVRNERSKTRSRTGESAVQRSERLSREELKRAESSLRAAGHLP